MTDEVVIESLGAQGDGVARGGALFVPGALPGERALVHVQGQRGTVEHLLARSAERILPVCVHFGTCGGCAVQHARDGFVEAWKAGLIATALGQRGITGVAIRPTLTSPVASRRRITVAGRRTRKGVEIGFHGPGEASIVPILSCAVARPALIAALPRLEELVADAASRRGEVRMVLTDSDAGVDVAVVEGRALGPPGLALLAGVAARAGLARLGWNGVEVVTLKPPTQTIGRARVLPPPGGFLQPTVEGQAALTQAVAEIVGPAARVADLFSGCGTFALPLAERAEVMAYEAEAPALAALDAAWRGTPGLRRIGTERRELFHRPLMVEELRRFDAVVIDPPRAGARSQAEQLARSTVARVASVSCNPASFARDARILIDGGYRLDWIQPIDQFRWSHHVELVGAFSR